MAVIAARVLPNLASRAAVVLAGIAVAAVVGLTRVYLRAHYWSDVVGGWALGAGVFGTVATIALLVSYIRQNGAPGWICRTPEATEIVVALSAAARDRGVRRPDPDPGVDLVRALVGAVRRDLPDASTSSPPWSASAPRSGSGSSGRTTSGPRSGPCGATYNPLDGRAVPTGADACLQRRARGDRRGGRGRRRAARGRSRLRPRARCQRRRGGRVEQGARGGVRVARGRARRAVRRGRQRARRPVRSAGAVVGRLHFRDRGEPNPPDLIRVVAAILALELDRARGPERASEAAVRDFLDDLVSRTAHRPREHRRARRSSWAPTSRPAGA